MVYDHVFKNSRYKVLIFEEKKWDSDKNEWVYPKHRRLVSFEISPVGSNRTLIFGPIGRVDAIYGYSNSYMLGKKVEKFVRDFKRKHG